MRRLKLQMQISVDDFVSTGPNDEQKWGTWTWKESGPYGSEWHYRYYGIMTTIQ